MMEWEDIDSTGVWWGTEAILAPNSALTPTFRSFRGFQMLDLLMWRPIEDGMLISLRGKHTIRRKTPRAYVVDGSSHVNIRLHTSSCRSTKRNGSLTKVAKDNLHMVDALSFPLTILCTLQALGLSPSSSSSEEPFHIIIFGATEKAEQRVLQVKVNKTNSLLMQCSKGLGLHLWHSHTFHTDDRLFQWDYSRVSSSQNHSLARWSWSQQLKQKSRKRNKISW